MRRRWRLRGLAAVAVGRRSRAGMKGTALPTVDRAGSLIGGPRSRS